MAKLDMIKLPGKAELEAFFKAVAEEEMRRQSFAYDPTVNVNESILRVLNTDIELEIIKPVNEQINKMTGGKQITGYAAKFVAALGNNYKEESKATGQKPTV
jgi:hypothetical protein